MGSVGTTTIADSTDLIELSRVIAEKSKELNEFYNQHGSDAAYDVWDPNSTSVSSDAEPLRTARGSLCEAASALIQRVINPLDSVLVIFGEVQKSAALRCAHKYKFANAVPLKGGASYDEIAKKVGLDTKSIKRLIPAIVASGIFRYEGPDRVVHSRLSHLMATDKVFNDFVGMCFNDSYQAVTHFADALEKWGPSEEPTESGFSLGQNTSDTFWKYLEDNPQIQERFSNAMTYMSTDSEFTKEQCFQCFDWGGIRDATIVDIGGSSGMVSMTISERFPNLQFIVQDYEETCKQGEEALPAQFRDRIRFQAHDMFNPQTPIPDKKVVYFLSSVLHDWSDKYCCKILQAIMQGMKPGDRIVLLEQVIPEPGTAGKTRETVGWGSDLSMWALFNGQERTAAQFRQLAKLASPKLKVVDINTPSIEVFISAVVMALEEDN